MRIKSLSVTASLLVLALLIAPLLSLGSASAQAQSPQPASRYFEETGYFVDHDAIWRFFQGRGGLATLGYPISRTFRFRGADVQLFQRHVLEVRDGQVRPLNLMDPDLLPLARYANLTFPSHDSAVASIAPPPDTPNYGRAVQEHLVAEVPNDWEGLPVHFREYFLLGASDDAGPRQFLTGLEIWGFPTSRPMRDPNNHNFVYQRFQRGIMHFDASVNVTKSVLIGEAFKRVLTGRALPAGLAADFTDSPFLRLFDPEAESGLARTVETIGPPILRENTDLREAFEPHVMPVHAVSSVHLFFVALGDEGRRGTLIGCNDSIVPVEVQIAPTAAPLRTALEELLQVGDQTYAQTDLHNALHQSRLQVQYITIADGHASVSLTGQLLSGGVCDVPRIEAQLNQTVLQFPHIHTASVFLDGTPLEQILDVRG
jgi:hypothetical protein